MKTLTTIFLALVIATGTAFAQPVKDKAVIPIGVTLNSVLRMNITSGGSIEFVFNTINDYTNGINPAGGDASYQTHFNVASSRDFDVTVTPETTEFIGTDNTANVMPLNHLEFQCTTTNATPPAWTLAGITVMSDAVLPLVTGTTDGTTAGPSTQNVFIIDWIVGDTNPLLGADVASDRYVLNVLLQLTSK